MMLTASTAIAFGASIVFAPDQASANTPAIDKDAAASRSAPTPSTKSNKSAFHGAFKKVRAEKLDRLFKRLKEAKDAKSGRTVAAQIWSTWMTTGNVELDFLLRQSQLALQEGGVAEAYGALDRVVEMAPDFAEGWNRRATLHFMMGRYPESVADIQQTLALEPRHFGALSGLGMIYMSRKNWKAALKAFEKAYEVNPWIQHGPALMEDLKRRIAGQAL
ncbi:MAG: tetratricopeptide repeat protein [Pseudomonadota bacterium]